jgi:hypothetical protein
MTRHHISQMSPKQAEDQLHYCCYNAIIVVTPLNVVSLAEVLPFFPVFACLLLHVGVPYELVLILLVTVLLVGTMAQFVLEEVVSTTLGIGKAAVGGVVN